VQADWSGTVEDAPVRIEHDVALQFLPKRAKRLRRGRIDVFIDQINDFVTVVEIKSTDWDGVKPQNRRKVLGSHRRQVMKYVDQYLDGDRVSVCAGIIYPIAPREPGLKEEVETYLNDHALQVVWSDDD
jgi:hypothetical protein